MGQNFLIDKGILKKIMAAADITTNDTILEIGPGIGTLTQALATVAKKVIAVEKDRAMVEILKETLKELSNIEIIQGNALLTTNYSLPTHYKIVANIPYYLTSPLIRKFLESENQPETMVLMVQKEVAQRICANPPQMSLLAVSVQYYAKATIISYVSKECFWPAPKVDSAIIKITPRNSAEIYVKTRGVISKEKFAPSPESRGKKTDTDLFFKIVKAGFLHPRKQLINNLCQGLGKNKEDIQAWLLKNNIEPRQRAQTLSVQDWINLVNSL